MLHSFFFKMRNNTSETIYNPGDLVILRVSGDPQAYIGEVIKVEKNKPIRIKISDTGPYANLKPGDFIIDSRTSHIYTEALANNSTAMSEFLERNKTLKVESGLAKLGVNDGNIQIIEFTEA
jgi:hypothetical protein